MTDAERDALNLIRAYAESFTGNRPNVCRALHQMIIREARFLANADIVPGENENAYGPIENEALPPAADKAQHVAKLLLEDYFTADEVETIAEVAAGLVDGRAVYGHLDISGSGRDYQSEALEEIRDLHAYAAMAAIKLRRMRGP